MSDEPDIVVLTGSDGTDYRCQLLEIFDLEDQEYALLIKLDEESEKLVIMRIAERDGRTFFQSITDEDEFQRVLARINELADQ